MIFFFWDWIKKCITRYYIYIASHRIQKSQLIIINMILIGTLQKWNLD